MKIDVISKDELQNKISVTIEPSDYEQKFKNQLTKYKDKVQLKGFRKGKVPANAVKKMFGKSILAELINDELQAGLSNYIKDNEINILGSPLPSEDQSMVDFDPSNLQDYQFTFDIGLSPQFEVLGVKGTDTYDKYKIKVSDEIIADEIEHMKKKLGKNEEVEEGIEDNDIITIEAKEISGGKVNSDAFATAFSVLVNSIGDDALKQKVLSQKKKQDFLFDISQIEKNATEKHIRKYLLNLDEDDQREVGNNFLGQVTKISRLVPAELNEEFFDQAFGKDKVKNVEEAKKEIRTNLEQYFDTQALQLTNREIMEQLMESNQVDIPETFLKRLLKETNENVQAEDIDKEFGAFAKNLKWTLIKNNLAKKYDVTIDQNEIREKITNKVRSYMAQYGMADPQMDMTSIVDKYMSNQKEVEKEYDELLAERLFAKINENVSFNIKEVTDEEFKEIVKKINEKVS